jgi:hypothetical protein
MLKIIKVKVIADSRVYRDPESIYNYITDPNSEEAFVIMQAPDGNYDMEILTDFSEKHKAIKNEDGVFAIRL